MCSPAHFDVSARTRVMTCVVCIKRSTTSSIKRSFKIVCPILCGVQSNPHICSMLQLKSQKIHSNKSFYTCNTSIITVHWMEMLRWESLSCVEFQFNIKCTWIGECVWIAESMIYSICKTRIGRLVLKTQNRNQIKI